MRAKLMKLILLKILLKNLNEIIIKNLEIMLSIWFYENQNKVSLKYQQSIFLWMFYIISVEEEIVDEKSNNERIYLVNLSVYFTLLRLCRFRCWVVMVKKILLHTCLLFLYHFYYQFSKNKIPYMIGLSKTPFKHFSVVWYKSKKDVMEISIIYYVMLIMCL